MKKLTIKDIGVTKVTSRYYRIGPFGRISLSDEVAFRTDVEKFLGQKNKFTIVKKDHLDIEINQNGNEKVMSQKDLLSGIKKIATKHFGTSPT